MRTAMMAIATIVTHALYFVGLQNVAIMRCSRLVRIARSEEGMMKTAMMAIPRMMMVATRSARTKIFVQEVPPMAHRTPMKSVMMAMAAIPMRAIQVVARQSAAMVLPKIRMASAKAKNAMMAMCLQMISARLHA